MDILRCVSNFLVASQSNQFDNPDQLSQLVYWIDIQQHYENKIHWSPYSEDGIVWASSIIQIKHEVRNYLGGQFFNVSCTLDRLVRLWQVCLCLCEKGWNILIYLLKKNYESIYYFFSFLLQFTFEIKIIIQFSTGLCLRLRWSLATTAQDILETTAIVKWHIFQTYTIEYFVCHLYF
jgi:hypothetical protein